MITPFVRRPLLCFAVAVLPLTCGCWTSKPGPAPPPTTGKKGFVDAAAEAGLTFKMGFLPNEQGESFKINLYDHGCGVAVGDYDGDGRDDIYLLNQLGPNAMFRNRGDGSFEDVTASLGVALDDRVSVGATFADVDNDGDQDLYVTSTRGGNVLYRNEGGKLAEDTEAAGLAHVGHSQTAVFFDYDRDGWLDLYLVQTSEWTKDAYDDASRYYPGKGDVGGLAAVVSAPKEYNILYHNRGDGTFENATESSGMKGRGWSGDVAVFDYDEDGWMDVFVTSMFGRAQLYHNNQGKSFSDVTLDVLGKTSFGGIGCKVFDFDNDGRLDIYIVDMHSDMWMGLDRDRTSLREANESEKVKFNYFYGPHVEGSAEYQKLEQDLEDIVGFRHEEVLFGNAFYRNLGEGKFEEISNLANLETFWPWGVATGDFDSDGFVDVFLPSGMGYPFYYWQNYLLMNTGRGSFTEQAFAQGIEPPAAGQFLEEKIQDVDCARSSRCAATADFDGDGRLEIIVNNFNHEPYFYKNQFPAKNWLALKLVGVKSNRDAIGAVARLTIGDKLLVRQVQAAGGYLSHSSKTLHFGLGDTTAIDSLEIRWPNGETSRTEKPAVNKLHTIQEPEAG